MQKLLFPSIYSVHSGSDSCHHLHFYDFLIIISCLDYCSNLLIGVLLLFFPLYSVFSTLLPVWYFKTEVRSHHSFPQIPPGTPFYFIKSKSQSSQWPVRPYTVSIPISLIFISSLLSPCSLCPSHIDFLAVTHRLETPSSFGPLHWLFPLPRTFFYYNITSLLHGCRLPSH